ATGLEGGSASRVAGVIVAFDDYRAVIPPGVGISDVVDDGGQLYVRLLLGGVGHPGQLPDVAVHGLLDGLHHSDGARLIVRPKYLVHIKLAQGHAEATVGGADATLPARLNFLLPGHVLAIELKVFV